MPKRTSSQHAIREEASRLKVRDDAILMMKIAFQLRKHLEKHVVGFLAGCNTVKELFEEASLAYYD